jgi:hypothetical protein
MPVKLVAEQEIKVGEALVLEGPSPKEPFAAVFEDDGDSGYFYALDTTRAENPIMDALHIYEVEGVSDRHLPSKVRIVWSLDDRKAALLINDYPHAVFDFAAKRGYCRSDFPPLTGDTEWSAQGHEWDDSVLELFA